MNRRYHTVVIGGGCLGCAAAFSIRRKLGKNAGKVAVIEKKVLGAGLSSRHSAIVRSANASPAAAKMARLSTAHWKNLRPLWGVSIPYEQPGALWIAGNPDGRSPSKWRRLETAMQAEGIAFSAIPHQEAIRLSRGAINLAGDETCYYEPEVLQLDSPQILNALQTAAKISKIEVFEHCAVDGFESDGSDRIAALHTSQGKIYAEHVVNAAGGWSPELFAGLGLSIPVALEPVYAANFLVSARDIPDGMPIVADYVNRAYFRRWRGSILHMHQPRSRNAANIARAFSRTAMNPEGANIIYDAFSFNVNHQQLEHYFAKVQNRFPKIGSPVYAGGFRSFFDITPDLKFILGLDSQIANLYHCLGAGQSLKYAPLFGELIAELIVDQRLLNAGLALEEFSIARFQDKPINAFWGDKPSGSHSL